MMRSSTVDRPRSIFHLAHADHWEAAKRTTAQAYESPITSKSLGFIQAADDAEVLRGIARNSRAQGVKLVLLEIDTYAPSLQGIDVIYISTSPAGLAAAGDEQPRLMGRLPVAAVVAATLLSSPEGGAASKSRSPPPPPLHKAPAASTTGVCCGLMFPSQWPSAKLSTSDGVGGSEQDGGASSARVALFPSLYGPPSFLVNGFNSFSRGTLLPAGRRTPSGDSGGGGRRNTWGAFDEEVVEFVERPSSANRL
mmetsp:Transcript_55747/g.110477  ORF Transcript_55747/g.110477 Transcript_55747/m.110477 type:complete len:252 (+) Transcript_55747:292-1047(+)